MDGAVYEGNAGREGRDGSQRAYTRLLSSNLQATVPADQARLCIRWRNPSPQAPHCDRSKKTAGERPVQASQDGREIASQSC